MSANGNANGKVEAHAAPEVTAAIEEHSRVTEGLRNKIREKREMGGGGLIPAVRELLMRHNDNCDACQRVRKLLPTSM